MCKSENYIIIYQQFSSLFKKILKQQANSCEITSMPTLLIVVTCNYMPNIDKISIFLALNEFLNTIL